MEFTIVQASNLARHGLLRLPHSVVETPVFMPVGTQGTVKGILPEQLIEMDCRIFLCNTFHLGHRPGAVLVRKAGGLHRMINWPRSLLTDSGGFQMVSLNDLMKVTEQGVNFQSPYTNEKLLLTPEESINIQQCLGADIMMQLDHVEHVRSVGPVVEQAMQRSVRWLDRCIDAHTHKNQALFPIIQGGLDFELRKFCIKEMTERAKIGIAIGGLSGGEDKDMFWRVVAFCCKELPSHLPRYVMGVGFPVDLVMCSLLGADMFDCVYPTRTARFGCALVRRGGTIHLNKTKYANDFSPVDKECSCYTCQNYTRAFIHSIVNRHHLDLMRRVREAIDTKSTNLFLDEFLSEQYPRGNVPKWVKDVKKYIDDQSSIAVN